MVTQSPIDRDLIETILAVHAAKIPEYHRYIDYYEGRHDLRFATVKWRNTFGTLFKQFADNMCAPIIDAPADRLQVLGFEVADEASKVFDTIWTYNRMPRKSSTVHEHALKTGDAYVIVWPDAQGHPQLSPNPAHQVCVYYDDNDKIAYASKLWPLSAPGKDKSKGQQWRLNIYYPNSVEKYITNATINGVPRSANPFVAYFVPGEMWPLPNPYGQVPVFHFANNPEMGVWGQSELWNIIPLQDALNKSIADQMVAMEFVSLPQRWATGLEVEEDDEGNPKIPFEAGVDRIWANPDETGRFGQFEQANLDSFSQAQNDFRLEMSRISRIPLHYLSLGGNSQSSFVSSLYPSGESLRTAEAPFVAKLEKRQVDFGDTWEDLMAFAYRIETGQEIDPTTVSTIWKPAEPKSVTDDLDNAIKKQTLGVPLETILEELGYSEELAKAAQPPVQNGNGSGNSQVDSRSNQEAGSSYSQG